MLTSCTIIYRITVGEKNMQIGETLVDAVRKIPNPYATAAAAIMKLGLALSDYKAQYFIFPTMEDANTFQRYGLRHFCNTTGEYTSSVAKHLSNNCFGDSRYLYFGFKTNESDFMGLGADYHVVLEVIPWVEEKSGWNGEIKQMLYDTCLVNTDDHDLYACAILKLESRYTLKEVHDLAEKSIGCTQYYRPHRFLRCDSLLASASLCSK